MHQWIRPERLHNGDEPLFDDLAGLITTPSEAADNSSSIPSDPVSIHPLVIDRVADPTGPSKPDRQIRGYR